MTFTCAICGIDSGTSLVCQVCRPLLSDHQKAKLMRVWHRTVVELAHCACEDCGHSAPFDSGELGGDHIETRGARPDLTYDITNGRCRCVPCHNKRHTGELPPSPSMKSKADEKPPKKATCKYYQCPLMPLSSGYCVRHQPAKGKSAYK